jgi:hypothetical protein
MEVLEPHLGDGDAVTGPRRVEDRADGGAFLLQRTRRRDVNLHEKYADHDRAP